MCGVTDRKYTYAELRDHSAALAVRLQKQFSMKQNEVVAVCLPNVPEFPIATLGAIEAGSLVTTVNPMYTPGEKGDGKLNFNVNSVTDTWIRWP